MSSQRSLLLLCLCLLCTCSGPSSALDVFSRVFSAAPVADPCYDEDRPKRCVPDFVNAAFGAPVRASSTCGERSAGVFCEEAAGSCQTCDGRFSAAALTDLNNPNNVTCWRSEPLSVRGGRGRVDNVRAV